MSAVGAILAAGLGTRLMPLTNITPKPLLPVAGKPLLFHGLDALACAGIQQVGVNAYHLGRQLDEALVDRNVQVIHEETLQGTGGGLRGISARLPRETLIALNGDALFGFPLAPLLKAHRKLGALATLVLRKVPLDAPFNPVCVDVDGRLQRIAEITGPDAQRSSLQRGVYTGVQIVEPELLDALPTEGACDVLRTAYRYHLEQRAPLFGIFVPDESPWVDVGTPSRYMEAHKLFIRDILPSHWLPAPVRYGCRMPNKFMDQTGIHGPCIIQEGAQIDDGALIGPDVFIGSGAHVGPSSRLENAIVLGGNVSGELKNVIVQSNGEIISLSDNESE